MGKSISKAIFTTRICIFAFQLHLSLIKMFKTDEKPISETSDGHVPWQICASPGHNELTQEMQFSDTLHYTDINISENCTKSFKLYLIRQSSHKGLVKFDIFFYIRAAGRRAECICNRPRPWRRPCVSDWGCGAVILLSRGEFGREKNKICYQRGCVWTFCYMPNL